VGHVNAHGASTIEGDIREAVAIRAVLGDVPVTAPKSFFGNLGAGSGAVEMAASLLALEHNLVPITLNYERPDPRCDVRVVHGQPLEGRPPTAMVLSQSGTGQTAAVLIGR
jgi:3-oxoacyl-[acyl-carrier-protein] synthase II